MKKIIMGLLSAMALIAVMVAALPPPGKTGKLEAASQIDAPDMAVAPAMADTFAPGGLTASQMVVTASVTNVKLNVVSADPTRLMVANHNDNRLNYQTEFGRRAPKAPDNPYPVS